MKRLHLEIIVLMAMVLLVVGAFSIAQPPAPAPKVGYVDFQKVLDDSVVGKKAQEKLKKKFGSAKAALEKKAKELKHLREEIEKKKPVVSQITLDEMKNTFLAKYDSYLKQKMMLQEQYNTEFVKLVSPMQKEISKIINSIAKERKYTLIFKYDLSARTEDSVLAEFLFFPSAIAFFDKGQDLTPEVLKRYDSAHKK